MAGDMIKLGGLWANKDKNGKTFLTGKLSPTVKIVIFQNQYRESENHPTHILYLAPVESQGREADQADEFFDDAAFQRGQAGASELRQQQGQRFSQGGHMAPEDVAPLSEEEYTAVRRSQPRPQQARPEERPAQRMGSGTGRDAGF